MKISLILMAVLLGGLMHLASAEECTALASHSGKEAIEYLQTVNGDARTRSCVFAAFQDIASLPPEQATPLLIKYLDYERPLTDSEKQGVFLTSDRGNLYPAVQALFNIGSLHRGAVEPLLITYLGEDHSGDEQGFKSGVYLLYVLRHTPAAIEDLKARWTKTTDPAVSQRLHAAAQALLKWCLPRETCEDAAK
ncbi:hypothetical protein GCM10011507_23640 [Edaphobacter acidisoli]|uniref:HEAT repeat domain-containing protein n=1 Tax=Edaphobacter acidisoli TaxID=2040573 RepID=A0A916RUM1_9BACT|nr:hypothetical protein [Edaphobacter acidisoli]GGA71265.1 hypothetical protein GCM10011507_23640 [Edaphobacter acidisoli]